MATAQTSGNSASGNPESSFSAEQWNAYLRQQQAQWNAFFKEWQTAVPDAGGYKDLFAQAGQQFLSMVQAFQTGGAQNIPPQDTATEWLAGLSRMFGGMAQTTPAPDYAETYAGMMSLGENMARAGQAWWAAFQNSNQNDPFAAPQAGLFDPLGFAASMPGVGYTREKQEDWAELYRLYAAFARATKKYNNAMVTVGLEAVQKFQTYLQSPPEGTAPLESLKDVFAKWVDICEDIYARYAMSAEYTAIYGETVNALMAFKKKLHAQADAWAGEMNLPTRTEVDSIYRLVHQLRRDNIALRQEVAALKKTPAAKPAARTATPEKPAAKAKKAAKAKPVKKAGKSTAKPAPRKPKGKR